MSAKKRILEHLKQRVGSDVPREDLSAVARVSEWARRIRELSQEGWDIETTAKGYRLRSLVRVPTKKRTNLTQKQRYPILNRDNSTCRRCGRTVDDEVKLVVDHIVPVDWGGTNTDENLWTLCEECNSGKKAWQSDADAVAMRRILNTSGARNRLREYFKIRAGQVCTREELQIVSGIAQYARRIRELRAEGLNIEVANPRGDYVLRECESL